MSKECNNCGKILQEGENCFCSEEISAAEETESTQTEVTESTVKLSKEVTNETADEAPGKSAGEESEETSQVRLQGKKREGEEAGNEAQNGAVLTKQEGFFSSDKTKEVIDNTSNYLKDMFKFSINFIKKPVISMKYNAVNHDFKKGLFFAVLQSLLFALFIVALTSKTLGGGYDFFGFKVKVPYLSIFFKSLIFYFVSFLLLPVSLFIVSKIFKLKSDIKAFITISGLSIIPVIIATIFLVIGVLISPYLSVLLTGGVVFSIILTYIGLSEAMSGDMDKVVYCIATGYVLYPILVGLVLKIVNPFTSLLSSISIF